MNLINLLRHIIHRKVTHVWTNLQPKAEVENVVENMHQKKVKSKNQQSSEAIEFKGLFRGGWEKTSYPGISAEGYRQKHKMQVASKKVYWKKTFS